MERTNTVMDQCRKPSGWLGRFTLWRMNFWHARVTDWGLAHILGTQAGAPVPRPGAILDVGCGGGATVNKLAALAAQGKVYGVDYSEESVAASKRKNARWIESGRVEIQHGSVSELPFSDKMFDLVTAVETHFFWPDLPGDMREIRRVLKPGGTLILIAEIYKGSNKRTAKLAEKYLPLTGMALLSVEEHRELFVNAGYVDVWVVEEREKGWICAWGVKG